MYQTGFSAFFLYKLCFKIEYGYFFLDEFHKMEKGLSFSPLNLYNHVPLVQRISTSIMQCLHDAEPGVGESVASNERTHLLIRVVSRGRVSVTHSPEKK